MAGGLVGTALLVWPIAVWLEVRKCERPKYRQLLTLGEMTRAFYDRALAIDVREYAPYVVAEVTVNADSMKDANSKGFRQIAGFIFGGNIKQDKIAMTSPVQTEADGQAQNGEESEKIAMTSPVTSEMLQGGKYKVAFVMPSKYKSSSELPKPKNAAVQLKNVPAHTLAAISWRGYPAPTESVVRDKEQQLRNALKGEGVEVADNALTKVYQYWPPFAPGPIKEYDVLLPVKSHTVPSGHLDVGKTA